MLEERFGHSSDLPSIGASGRSAHLGCLPGLLSDGDAETPSQDACFRLDTPSGAGETCHHSNAGCVFPDYRWPPPGHAALRRAEPRAGPSAPSTEPRPTAATASAHYLCCLVSSVFPTQNVVETFGVRSLKRKIFPTSNALNCEGRVSRADGDPAGAFAAS